MKKTLSATATAIVFTAATAFAQMSGGTMSGMQHEGMGGQQGMMQGGMMSPEMMKDMSGVMNHMMEMMQAMSHTMGHKTITEHMQMADMSTIMEEMSGMMHTLSQQMAKGQMSPTDARKMQDRLRSLQKQMKAIEKSGK